MESAYHRFPLFPLEQGEIPHPDNDNQAGVKHFLISLNEGNKLDR